MNDAASAPGASLIPETTDLFTTGAFALIAVLTALTIAGILYGMHRARCRRKAEREVAAHNERVEEQASGPDRVESEDRHDFVAAPMPPPAAEAAPSPTAVEPVAPAGPPTPTGSSPADGPVTQLKGLGPKVAATLAGHGLTTVGQLAALTDDEANALDARMGPFTGRMGRDRWQEQARFLAAGDKAGFEAVFGRL